MFLNYTTYTIGARASCAMFFELVRNITTFSCFSIRFILLMSLKIGNCLSLMHFAASRPLLIIIALFGLN
jgi:hypothetical protein